MPTPSKRCRAQPVEQPRGQLHIGRQVRDHAISCILRPCRVAAAGRCTVARCSRSPHSMPRTRPPSTRIMRARDVGALSRSQGRRPSARIRRAGRRAPPGSPRAALRQLIVLGDAGLARALRGGGLGDAVGQDGARARGCSSSRHPPPPRPTASSASPRSTRAACWTAPASGSGAACPMLPTTMTRPQLLRAHRRHQPVGDADRRDDDVLEPGDQVRLLHLAGRAERRAAMVQHQDVDAAHASRRRPSASRSMSAPLATSATTPLAPAAPAAFSSRRRLVQAAPGRAR